MNIKYLEKIPQYVLDVGEALKQAGFKCYLVGGAVRDISMGLSPNDYDLTSDATPKEMEEIFPKSIATGAKFGTIIVLIPDHHGETHSVEITTFRSEADYVDGRWPTKIEFTDDLSKDLGRRDFTVNAMAINIQTLDDNDQANDLIDLFGGINDIRERKLRAVGTPYERMLEDGLRAYKGCRLASQLGFEIDEETSAAIKNSLVTAQQVSIERVRDEFLKLIKESPKPSVGIELLRTHGLLALFLPELEEGIGVDQGLHRNDVYHHALHSLDAAEDDIKLVALLHDIAKPRVYDGKIFPEHEKKSSELAKDILSRMKFPKSEIHRIRTLIRWHMFDFSEWKSSENAWSDPAIRRFVKRVGEENIDDLFRLRIADASDSVSEFEGSEILALESRISDVRQGDMFLKISDLAIDGNDLMKLGVEKGPRIGMILGELLEKVIEDPSINERKKLLNLVKEFI